jgi:hypothetical protein
VVIVADGPNSSSTTLIAGSATEPATTPPEKFCVPSL